MITVPADIPGILQPGTICWCPLWGLLFAEKVCPLVPGHWVFDTSYGCRSMNLLSLDIDLMHRVSRSHVAWWARDRLADAHESPLEAGNLLRMAAWGEDMNDDQVQDLAHLVLRLAESEPSETEPAMTRAEFEEATGKTPEVYLRGFKDDSLDAMLWWHRAQTLVRS